MKKNKETPVKHTVNLPNMRAFTVWNENGIVKQSGIGSLPDNIKSFTGSNKLFEAGAFISGLLWAAEHSK